MMTPDKTLRERLLHAVLYEVCAMALLVPLAFGALAAAVMLATGDGWAGEKGARWQVIVGIGMACAVTALPILVLTALDALEAQPGGSWILGLTAAGLMAFGAFAFVEARWRRIRPPRDLSLG